MFLGACLFDETRSNHNLKKPTRRLFVSFVHRPKQIWVIRRIKSSSSWTRVMFRFSRTAADKVCLMISSQHRILQKLDAHSQPPRPSRQAETGTPIKKVRLSWLFLSNAKTTNSTALIHSRRSQHPARQSRLIRSLCRVSHKRKPHLRPIWGPLLLTILVTTNFTVRMVRNTCRRSCYVVKLPS